MKERQSFIERVPSASAYCERVIEEVDRHKLFPEEQFADLAMGVLSTTGLDLQGDMVTLAALKGMQARIEQNGLWGSAEHDPLIPMIGRVLSSQVFFDEASGTHFLAGVFAYYDSQTFPSFESLGIRTAISEASEFPPDLPERVIRVLFSEHEVPGGIVSASIAEAPPTIDRDVGTSFRKAADPHATVHLLVNLGFLLFNPFSKKFLERLGERAADGVIATWAWVTKSLWRRLQTLKKRRLLLVIETDYKNCRIEFALDNTDEETLARALQSLHLASGSAVALIDQIEHLKPEVLVYEFDTRDSVWKPLHAATRGAGVFASRSIPVDHKRYKGLSIAGVAENVEVRESDQE